MERRIVFHGQDKYDFVGPGRYDSPNGVPDFHIKITGVNTEKEITDIEIKSPPGHCWRSYVDNPQSPSNWVVGYFDAPDVPNRDLMKTNIGGVRHKVCGEIDLFFEPATPMYTTLPIDVTVYYGDATLDKWLWAPLKEAPAYLTAVTFNKPSGNTVTTTTTLSPEVMNQEKPVRDNAATKLVLEKDRSLNSFKNEIEKRMPDLLEGKIGSYVVHKGDTYIYIDSNVKESQMGGIGHTISIEFYDIKWNQISDSIDIGKLQEELEELTKGLASVANEKHMEELAQVAMASKELKKANAPKMLSHLKKAGTWVFGEVKKGGLPLLLRVFELLSVSPP